MQAPRDMDSRVLNRALALARSARPYLPGFGTSGSLLAGAVLMFVLASALVAFRGWPHVGAEPSPGDVVVSPAPAAATGSTSSRRLALFTVAAAGGAPATGATPAAPHRGRAGTGRGGAATPPPHSLGRPVTASTPVAAPTHGGSTPCASGCGSTIAQPGSAATGPTQPVQQVIRQTTGALGGVLSGTGKRVGSVLQQTTGAAAGAVQQVSPSAAGVVNSAGAGAAKTVTGVTQTIAGALSGLRKH